MCKFARLITRQILASVSIHLAEQICRNKEIICGFISNRFQLKIIICKKNDFPIFDGINKFTVMYLKQFNVRLNFGNDLCSHLRTHIYLDANRIHGQCGRVISKLKSISEN